ncbi:hypothetical protein RI367_003038 [Sorochytrium milnesiophthora]
MLRRAILSRALSTEAAGAVSSSSSGSSSSEAWLAPRRQALKHALRQTVVSADDPAAADSAGPDLTGVETISSSDRTLLYSAELDGRVVGVGGSTDADVEPPQPEFEVHSAGLGSMLLAKIPPFSKVYTKKGTVIGQSENVASTFSMEGSPLHAAMRRLGGGPLFFQQMSTQRAAGDVMIAPKAIGDIAVVDMDGTGEFFVRRHSFLASTTNISLSMRLTSLRMTTDAGIVHYRVSGKGRLAITTYGGLYRLLLGPGEKYLVSPKHLIAWDASMTPAEYLPDTANTAASTSSTSKTQVPESDTVLMTVSVPPPTTTAPGAAEGAAQPSSPPEQAGVAQQAWLMASSAWRGALGLMPRMNARLKRWVLGEQELVQLQGPGEMYVASRVLPRFELLKSMSSPTSDTAATAEQQPTKPLPAQHAVQVISLNDTATVTTVVRPSPSQQSSTEEETVTATMMPQESSGKDGSVTERPSGVLGGVAGTVSAITQSVRSGVQKVTKRQ